jgi:hypothetical protein
MPDQRLIDQRRIAAGLTIWQVADRLGLNVEVVRSLTEIEEFSRDSEQLDRLGFGTVRHLCTLLDIDLNCPVSLDLVRPDLGDLRRARSGETPFSGLSQLLKSTEVAGYSNCA